MILSQDDAVHVVLLAEIAAHDKVLILEVLDFDPVLCTFVEIVAAVAALGNDALQFLRLASSKNAVPLCSI